jgi:hypothetical protein
MNLAVEVNLDQLTLTKSSKHNEKVFTLGGDGIHCLLDVVTKRQCDISGGYDERYRLYHTRGEWYL